jgi:hypothetical protein
MSISNIFVKIVGIILIVVGLALALSAVGISVLPVAFVNEFWALVVGALFIGAGVVLIKGGNITP